MSEEESNAFGTEVNLTEEEDYFDQIVMHEELQHLVRKLHRFARLQLAKLAH